MSAQQLHRIFLVSLGLAALLTVAFFGPPTAHADGLVIVDCPPGPPEPPIIEPATIPCIFGPPCPTPPIRRPPSPVNCAAYLNVKNHNVTVTVDEQIARTHVQQTFVNMSDFQLEGTYIFPLPEDAAVNDFAMWVNGAKLEGRVLPRDEARRIYEDIVRRRRDPALLEYIGKGAFQARIFPIEPHAEKQVEISYSQVLKNEAGLVKYIYPLSTERFSPQPLANVSVSVNLKSSQALKAIYSPSHQVSISRPDDYNALVGYEASNVKPDRDFVLYYSVSPSEIGATLLSYKPDPAKDGFFLLLVTPQVKTTAEKVVAKDVILVLDTSGSMQGSKIDQAKRALTYVLEHLNPDDRFNVITFSTGVIPFGNTLQPASARHEAEGFVDRIAAGGSTDINRALLEALSVADRERPTVLVFLTDGLPTTGEVEPAKILQNVDRAASSNVRLFTFGVGDDVNTVLLDSLSESHRGASAYVRPSEKIDEVVSEFYTKVSTPVLSDIQVDWGGARVTDLYPYPLPDLFAGSQLVLVGRYQDVGPASITLKGNVNGQQQSFRFEDLTLKSSGGDQFIAPLWATRKIGYLLAQLRLHGENKEAVDEIVALALRYGIATPYTSFLVDERQDVFSPQGLGGATEQFRQSIAPAAAPTAGATAVKRSQANRSLQDATTGANESDLIKQIGDKAFLLRNGVWTDTTFDPATMKSIRIQFGGGDYFDLLTQHPEWAPYVALGERVIFVLDGRAYEITIQ